MYISARIDKVISALMDYNLINLLSIRKTN